MDCNAAVYSGLSWMNSLSVFSYREYVPSPPSLSVYATRSGVVRMDEAGRPRPPDRPGVEGSLCLSLCLRAFPSESPSKLRPCLRPRPGAGPRVGLV